MSENFCCKFIQKVDHFGVDIQFKMNKDNKFRTTLGGYIFFAYIIFATSYFFYGFRGFWNREKVSLLYSYKSLKNFPSLNLSAGNFSIIFGHFPYWKNDEGFQKIHQYFDYSARIIEWLGYNYTTTDLKTRRCIASDMPSYASNIFEGNEITDFYCLDNKDNLSIVGFEYDNVYRYIEVKISLKTKYVGNDTEVKNFMKEYPIVSGIFFPDYANDYENFTNPLPSYLQMLSASVLLDRHTETEIFMQYMYFTSENGLLLKDTQNEMKITLDTSSTLYFSIDECQTEKDDWRSSLGRFKIVSSNKRVTIERRYQNFPSFLAEMGGLLTNVLVILSLCVNYLNTKALHLELIDAMEKYQGNENYDIDYLLQVFKEFEGPAANNNLSSIKTIETPNHSYNLTPISQRIHPSPTSIEQEIHIKQEASESKIIFKSIEVHPYNKEENNLLNQKSPKYTKMSIFEVLFATLCGCCGKAKKKKMIFKETLEDLFFYLDIFRYIKKLREIDLIKYLLFTPEQLAVLNFLSKPIACLRINHNGGLKEFNQESKRALGLHELEISQLYNASMKLASERLSTKVNSKLLKLLKEEIDFFKMNSNFDSRIKIDKNSS